MQDLSSNFFKRKGTPCEINVIKLTKTKPPTLGEVARDSVTERALEIKSPLSRPTAPALPVGEPFMIP